ncbi:MAG: error-prone DNA polymerase, partial [Planctomycetales bacterium]|nr:error-prone DNA polymerase [Planctomycetales bacterium]
FAGRCYLLAELHRGVDDAGWLAKLQQTSRTSRLPLVASGGVLYHAPSRMVLHDVLTAIRCGTTVAAAAERLPPNAQRHLRGLDELREIFHAAPDALQRTVEIADRCTFSLDELRYEYPEELAPAGLTPMEHLSGLTWQQAQWRYPGGIPEKIRSALRHELKLIEDLHYEAYFLTVWDLVQFARRRGILCQGRGSAANSAVCYCLGITAVDPARTDMLFERFISRERDEAPDIDVDFEHERREEVLQYVYDKYGRNRAGLTAVTITYRTRSAIRDVGKALGLSLDLVDKLAKNTDGYRHDNGLAGRCAELGIAPESPLGERLLYCIEHLIGFPRHLSQHVGGMVITRGALDELVPIENAAMAERTVIQWNKDDLDALGILKVDCLALGMLTAIGKCFRLIEARHGRRLTLADIPADDAAVYDMICRGDTIGVFQIESRAQMSMLPRLRPRCYYDLVIEVAIVRPGPIQGQMVHPYLRRRNGDEPVDYPNEAVRHVLEKTLGVPIFQEQCMRLAVVAAGFTPGEADQLRRAMGAWRRPGVIDEFRQRLVDGMTAHGLGGEFAEQVYRQIRGFGEYGFPESHAASFALLVYVSAWLKCHYPAAYTAAIINSQPMGFYAPAQLVRDARDHGVEVRPVDVNHSDWGCTLESPAAPPESNVPPESDVPDTDATVNDAPDTDVLRLGMRLLVGLGEAVVARIVAARGKKAFRSVDEFTRRIGLPRATVVRLAEADAFGSLAEDRRRALWDALVQERRPRSLPLFDSPRLDETKHDSGTESNETAAEPDLPALDQWQQVVADYRSSGLSLRGHPLAFFRDELARRGVTPADQLRTVANNQPVRVAGLVLLRQRPSTAKGITFVTLEDETGTVNLVLHQKTWERFARITRHAPVWLADGRLEAKDTVIHVIVRRLEDFSPRAGGLATRSRDFR